MSHGADDHHASSPPKPLNLGSERPSHRYILAHAQSSLPMAADEMTPPPTPHGSSEDLVEELQPPQTVFPNFLRAFCPFQPEPALSTSTVTVPLDEGDIILVHSVHTNGWADGTLLTSGARGWLPTNYCDAYDHESIRVLLNALLTFWDMLRDETESDMVVFTNQNFVGGMVAGVRCLLDRSDCLDRDSVVIRTHDVLRRGRKSLLRELTTLVKTTRRLQDMANGKRQIEDEAATIIHDIKSQAFKVVVRGVRFLDVCNNIAGAYTDGEPQPALALSSRDVPPTPPADAVTFSPAEADGSQRTPSVHPSEISSDSRTSNETALGPTDSWAGNLPRRPSTRTIPPVSRAGSTRSSLTRSATSQSLKSTSRPSSVQFSLPAVSHRVSYSNQTNLVSYRIGAAHDAFLSHQGSFIGRLHLQSRFPADLLVTTQQSASASRALQQIAEAVWERDLAGSEPLKRAKENMQSTMAELLQATREMLHLRSSAVPDETDVMTQEDSTRLMSAATHCVKAAGECVAQTSRVIERIGDFEFEQPELNLSDVLSKFPAPAGTAGEGEDGSASPPPEQAARSSAEPACQASGRSLEHKSFSRPHPVSSSVRTTGRAGTGSVELPQMSGAPARMKGMVVRTSDVTPVAGRTLPADEYGVGSASTDKTSFSGLRESGFSPEPHSSTRATTPDLSTPASPPALLPRSYYDACESRSTLAEDCEETEARVLETTFAHELIYSKDGQISGGTLPALIERLTTHDTTPDSLFVSTFYLTFRLFTTPVELAEALVDRFQYVAGNPGVAGTVQLRVYNVFKGWLESHWRNDCDSPALPIIVAFATDRLQRVLPAVGKRLAELAEKVSAACGPSVPRLLSSLGKSNASMTPSIPPDSPVPPHAMSKSQSTALKHWRQFGTSLSILDLDPLEMARQLTIKESGIFCSILPEELLGQEWTKGCGSLARNVRAKTTLSTNLTTWVAETILETKDVKRRAAIVKQWIKIANMCLELNNYDTLMAIVCSLNSSGIVRLKKTWEALSQKTKAMLENLKMTVEVSRNYAVLRQRLQGHVPPCLPFLGIYLTDLTFVDVGNHTTRQLQGDGEQEGMSVINFDKHLKTAKIIGELQRFQIPYRLAEMPEIQDWIQTQIETVCSSDESNVQNHYRRSLLLEPREASTSAQRHVPTDSSSGQLGGGGGGGLSMTTTTSAATTVTTAAWAATTTATSTTTTTKDNRFDFLGWAYPNRSGQQ